MATGSQGINRPAHHEDHAGLVDVTLLLVRLDRLPVDRDRPQRPLLPGSSAQVDQQALHAGSGQIKRRPVLHFSGPGQDTGHRTGVADGPGHVAVIEAGLAQRDVVPGDQVAISLHDPFPRTVSRRRQVDRIDLGQPGRSVPVGHHLLECRHVDLLIVGSLDRHETVVAVGTDHRQGRQPEPGPAIGHHLARQRQINRQ